jgi:hypothetical protein
MLIVAVAWIYVVLLMSLTEKSVIAGTMTFVMYCVVPLSIILYLFRSPQRKRARQEIENSQKILNEIAPTENLSGADEQSGKKLQED